jgi:hypothetical protein
MSIQQRELGAGHLLTSGTRNTGKEWIVVAGETITANQIVCCKGVDDAHVQVFKADQGAATTRSSPLFLAMHGANAGDQLRVSEMNVISSVNTAAGTAGNPIYLGTAGAWQLAAPANPVKVGVVLTVNATTGAVLFATPRA